MKNTSALLIIDVQNDMFENSYMGPVAGNLEFLARLKSLIDKARAANVPVIYVQHNETDDGAALKPGSHLWQIHPHIAPHTGELIVQKFTPDSFHETNLQSELDKRGIKQLVIAGIQTEYCVDTTTRRARSLGYGITLASDGHSTWNNDVISAEQIIAHHNATLRGSFAKLKTCAEIVFAD